MPDPQFVNCLLVPYGFFRSAMSKIEGYVTRMNDDQMMAASTLVMLARMVVDAHENGLLVARDSSVADTIKALKTAANDAAKAGIADRKR